MFFTRTGDLRGGGEGKVRGSYWYGNPFLLPSGGKKGGVCHTKTFGGGVGPNFRLFFHEKFPGGGGGVRTPPSGSTTAPSDPMVYIWGVTILWEIFRSETCPGGGDSLQPQKILLQTTPIFGSSPREKNLTPPPLNCLQSGCWYGQPHHKNVWGWCGPQFSPIFSTKNLGLLPGGGGTYAPLWIHHRPFRSYGLYLRCEAGERAAPLLIS